MRTIDNFGRPYNPERTEPMPYQVDEASAFVTYIRYTDGSPCAIHRITIAGTVTQFDWAYGDWANRASLTYKPINDPAEVI